MPRPDEGLIHAWLDGQLPPDEAARVEQLAATDPEWAAAVAEARGLVAASSRILAALDHVPSGVIPRPMAAPPRRVLPWWTKIAAALVVAVGGSIVVLRETPDAPVSLVATKEQPTAPTPTQAAPRAVSAPASGVARAQTPPPAKRAAQDAVRPGPIAGVVTAAAPSRDAAVAGETKDLVGAERAAREREATTAEAAKAAPAPEALAAATPPSAKNALPAQRVTNVGGVAGGAAAAQRAEARQAPICYRVLPDSAPPAAAVVMRLVRVDGDTVRLEGTPVHSETAWLVPRGASWRGVMITRGGTARMGPATGILTPCPTP